MKNNIRKKGRLKKKGVFNMKYVFIEIYLSKCLFSIMLTNFTILSVPALIAFLLTPVSALKARATFLFLSKKICKIQL